MYYCNIKYNDVADGPGCRTTLFVSGCTHHCEGCFQPETWDFTYGEPYTDKVEQEILDSLKPVYVSGLTLLGGEPFEPEHQRALLSLLRRIREEYPKKNIWAFSGYLYEELTGQIEGTGRARCEVTDEILSLIDVLVDGKFILSQRDTTLKFKGSPNQNIIDVQKSLAEHKLVLFECGE